MATSSCACARSAGGKWFHQNKVMLIGGTTSLEGSTDRLVNWPEGTKTKRRGAKKEETRKTEIHCFQDY